MAAKTASKAIILHPNFIPEPNVKIITRIRKCLFFEDPNWKKLSKISVVAGVFGYSEHVVKKVFQDEVEKRIMELNANSKSSTELMKIQMDGLRKENEILKAKMVRLEEIALKNQQLLTGIQKKQNSRWWW